MLCSFTDLGEIIEHLKNNHTQFGSLPDVYLEATADDKIVVTFTDLIQYYHNNDKFTLSRETF